jgi:DNA-binding transcriptional regulator GbsR (MarR family)
MNKYDTLGDMLDIPLHSELSLHFETEHDFPPLASKIYSLLILCKTKYLTFDEIKKLTQSSKSSVSNQLNYLIDEGRVDFDYKGDKRKRYFKTKQDYLKKTLESHLSNIQKEIDILTKINHYKEDKDFNKNLVAIFKNHLMREKNNILSTIDQLNQTSHNLKTHEK